MAKIEIIKEADGNMPRTVECVEVTVWGAGGHPDQQFCIGSGANFNASTNFWLEIRYSVQGLPLFYTRNVLSHAWSDVGTGQLERLEKFQNGEFSGFGFGDMLPETGILLNRDIVTYPDGNGVEHTSSRYTLKISIDLGAVFGQSAPGERMLDIRLELIELEDGLRFMRDLIQELAAASQGRHPDSANLAPGQSDWPFARDLNRRAYDQIGTDYQSDYFANALLAESFDGWLAELPNKGHILDAGCGHGNPVIARLLEKGFQVTGSDLSPVMLAHAREQFPDVQFWERASTEIDAESVFDGACSFSSVLYLDPVDFFHSIHRLYLVLKPGGLLFLCGYDLHPAWRGNPYHVDLDHWMWGGTRSLDETIQALEEHGYFKVLKVLETDDQDERQKKIQQFQDETEKRSQEWLEHMRAAANISLPAFPKTPANVAYSYVIIAQKQAR